MNIVYLLSWQYLSKLVFWLLILYYTVIHLGINAIDEYNNNFFMSKIVSCFCSFLKLVKYCLARRNVSNKKKLTEFSSLLFIVTEVRWFSFMSLTRLKPKTAVFPDEKRWRHISINNASC